MNVKTILFPTDFSHTGDAALALAASLARDSNARLLIVHVAEPPAVYGGGEMYYGTMEPDTETLKAMLNEIAPEGTGAEESGTQSQLTVERRLITGDPAHALIRLAEEEAADLIVMGTHGRTGLMRALMGSVAETVVRRAPCPVLTLRQPGK